MLYLLAGSNVCGQRPKIIAHDPAVLSQVQGALFIPFLLFHRVEMTGKLQCTVLLYLMPMLVLPSVKFKLFGYRRCMMRMPYEEQLISLSACTANSKLCTSYPEFEQKFQNPGEKVIPSCIAGNCLKKEHLYTTRMWYQNPFSKLIFCVENFGPSFLKKLSRSSKRNIS